MQHFKSQQVAQKTRLKVDTRMKVSHHDGESESVVVNSNHRGTYLLTAPCNQITLKNSIS